MSFRFLHTNDFHGTCRGAVLDRLMQLRAEVDLYFDSGDCIKAGNLAIPLKPEEAWKNLDALRCTAGTLGNRESHVLAAGQKAKVAGAQHPLLVSNMVDRKGELVFQESMTLGVDGVRIGVLGVMVPMVTERMKSQAASAYLWKPPIATAARVVEKLRPEVDLLIALTHIGISEDRKLAQQVAGIDFILGGHSHTVLATPERLGTTWICQGGSHGRFAGVYEWSGGVLTGGLVSLS
ncbi:MAG: metallophosphoesterase [Armatimonadetes bacterium]|nr:metallophosphoesterase [Armatimonadota bacterium]